MIKCLKCVKRFDSKSSWKNSRLSWRTLDSMGEKCEAEIRETFSEVMNWI